VDAIVLSDRWPPGFFGPLHGPGMASLGATAAIAYSGRSAADTSSPSSLRVQLVDSQGVRTGPPMERVGGAGEPSAPSIASDGQRALACWETAGQTECVTSGPASSELVPVYAGAGFTPAVVHGSTGWLVAARMGDDPSAQVVLQKLGPQFEGLGGPAAFPGQAASPTRSSSPFAIAATESGYVLVFGDPMRAQRLDGDLHAVGEALDLGKLSLWSFISLAATDTTIALGLGKPYAATLTFVNAANQVTTAELSGGVKEGMPIGLLADRSTLAGLWLAPTAGGQTPWHFQYPLDSTPAASIGPGGSPWSLGTNLVLARVGDGFLAALADSSIELQVLRIGR